MRSQILLGACACARYALAQEALTLPPPCQLDGGITPLTPAPAWSLATTSGSIVSFPGGVQLPLVVMAVDEGTDPGGVLLATDPVEVDRFLHNPPPISGSFVFVAYAHGGGRALAANWEARLALLPPPQALAWRPHLIFAALSVPELRAAGSPVALILDGWQSPRLWVTDLTPVNPLPPWPRVDGYYECFQWPSAMGSNYAVSGPVKGCDPKGAGSVAPGSMLLVTDVDTPSCPPDTAARWARTIAPGAAGAIIASNSTAIIGRHCTDTFVDAAFFPVVVPATGGSALAQRLTEGPVNITLNYSCSTGVWFAIDTAGLLNTVAWRKYTSASALRWSVDDMLTRNSLASAASSAFLTVPLLPVDTLLNAAAVNVTFSVATIAALRGASVRAGLDFSLTCPGSVPGDDNPCGAWDRIIGASASCWPQGQGGDGLSAAVEIARYITPFRRASGRWITDASVLLGLIGNGSSIPPPQPWTCTISASSCCEPWTGKLTLLAWNETLEANGKPGSRGGGSSGAAAMTRVSGGVPFAVISLIFPNAQTHFGPGYNENRTMSVVPPSSPFARVLLVAIISGHGSDPPPPVAVGCEYAPTSHAFSLGDTPLVVNSSDIAFDQYMLAGSQFGCESKIAAGLGVIPNQHGDWLDGRNGWCPGQAVAPLVWDVSSAFLGAGAVTVSYSALSYYVGGGHPSAGGCGGDIFMSAAVVFS